LGLRFHGSDRPSEAIKASQRAWILSSASSDAAWEYDGFVGKAVCLDLISFHLALAPPSTAKAIPVTHSASGEARNSTHSAMSWVVPKRGQGVSCKRSLCHCSASALLGRVSAVGVRPGQTAFTLIRWGPYVTANCRVRCTTAAFEVP